MYCDTSKPDGKFTCFGNEVWGADFLSKCAGPSICAIAFAWQEFRCDLKKNISHVHVVFGRSAVASFYSESLIMLEK